MTVACGGGDRSSRRLPEERREMVIGRGGEREGGWEEREAGICLLEGDRQRVWMG